MSVLETLKSEASGLSVLYAEDEDSVSKQVGLFLGKFFTDVKIVKNGYEGLAAYKERKRDIVITDIAMPIMSGLEMAKAINL